MLCSDVAVCSAIRLGGSTLPSSRRPATGPDSISCRRWSTLAPPPWRRVLPAGPRPSPLRSTAGRRAALVLTSAHALEACLEACSAACPLHCLWARGDVRLSSELSPPLRRRERRRYHRVAARGAPALPTRGSAGRRHCRRSCAGRGHPSPSRLSGRRGAACAHVCGRQTTFEGDCEAAAPAAAPLCTRAALWSPLQPR